MRELLQLRDPMNEATTGNESRRRVLVVDDERTIAETLGIILRKSGFDTAVVYDGQAAVDKAENWRPDAVVSDVIMPKMNGIDAAIRIAALLPACRIVLLSGQAMTADLVHQAKLKGHYFEILAKPVPPQELIERLRGL